MSESFEEKLEYGNGGEQQVMDLLLIADVCVIPTFDYKTAHDKAPMIHSFSGELSPPDLDCCKDGKRFWVEVKRYGTSPWNRKMQCNVHGIRERHYNTYIEVEQKTGCPVYLAIMEEGIDRPDGHRDETGVVLWARLAKLTAYNCLCGCASGARCRAPIKNSVYFKRDDFMVKWILAKEAV